MKKILPNSETQSKNKPIVKRHKNKRWIRLVSVFLCVIILLSGLFLSIADMLGLVEARAGGLFFSIADMLGLFEAKSGILSTFCIIDNRMAFYDFVEITEKGDFTFGYILHRKGELFETIGKYKIYKVKNRGDLVYLIFDDGTTLNYGKFSCFLYVDRGSSNEEFRESMKTSFWYEDGFLNDDNLTTLVNEPYTYELVLKTIYNVTSASEIKKVKFEKAKYDVPNEVEVGVKSVTLTKTDDIEKIYGIFCSLQREIGSVPVEFYEKERQYTERGKLLSKASRRVTVKLRGGENIVFRYSPVAGMLYENGSLYYDYLAEADNNWLIKTAKIDIS